ncbi:glycoside hydrolase family 32 protein [Subtercola sp. RTI3]|uniref:glycoside hydrolase family 32 protein n=1 Tax=Subtercola sp. RTI3 TaxID=3048639 RepID=UPI002B23E5B3|nr:glycoside hydrolase family 32 protein [Subtercola sp. RTI3]MEA9984314.1 glycoside hydrolase family 32 protein [Subtercola sp. RTI3]
MTDDADKPVFHFTPQRNWMNDPNGLVYLDGVYHLFFQYNPDGNDWGNMSWGHATSTDLLSWAEQSLALPYTQDEQIFSGSIVVDHDNTTGFGQDGVVPLVAIYTRVTSNAVQAQALAFSLDRGMTWQKYHANPVLDRNSSAFRDPKVFRAADRHGRERWVMVAVEAEQRMLLVYSSHDLITWAYESTFGPFGDEGVVWECPDLFALNLNGDPSHPRWVLVLSTNKVPDHDSAAFSFTGHFDGHVFVADDAETWRPLDYGRDFYAAVSFANTPDACRIILGWANNWQYAADAPTYPWRGAMTLPRQLELTETGITQNLPAVTEEALPAEPSQTYQADHLEGPVIFDSGRHYRFRLTCTLDDAAEVSVGLLSGAGMPAAVLHYAAGTHTLSFERTRSGRNEFHPRFAEVSSVRLPSSSSSSPQSLSQSLSHRLELDIFVDGCIVEVFANRGAATLTMQAFSAPDAREIVLSADGRAPIRARVELYDLTQITVTNSRMLMLENVAGPPSE